MRNDRKKRCGMACEREDLSIYRQSKFLILEQNIRKAGTSRNIKASIEGFGNCAIDNEQFDVKLFGQVVTCSENDIVSTVWLVELPGRFEQLKKLFDDSAFSGLGNDADHVVVNFKKESDRAAVPGSAGVSPACSSVF